MSIICRHTGDMWKMDIMQEIRSKARVEEFDYLFLLGCLSSYKQPRDKITKLLKKGSVIRVKKGLYVFGENYRKRPYSLELLGNLIYGPSYISFEYALSYHGLIPESVLRVTSASYKKNKLFETEVGAFIYYAIPQRAFSLGIMRKAIDAETHFLIASKEKALADYLVRIKPFASEADLLAYLVEGVRIDEESLFDLKTSLIKEISQQYQNKNVTLLWKLLKK